jgi:hypothetical protein
MNKKLKLNNVKLIFIILKVAEKFYIKANHPKECIEMYNKAGKWERAFKVCRTLKTYLSF